MAIVDAQRVNAANSNAAWVSKTVDSTIIAVPTLANAGSGATVTNPQKAINKAFEGVGATGENDTTINDYANNNYLIDGDSRKTAIEKLDAALNVVQNLPATFAGDKTFSDDVIITGDLTVNGSNTVLNTTTVESEDNNILLNKGGVDAGSEGAGIEIKRTTTNAALQFENALASKFKIGLLGSLYEIIVSGIDQTIAGIKTFSDNIIAGADLIFDTGGTALIKTKDDTATTQQLIIESGDTDLGGSNSSGAVSLSSGVSDYSGSVGIITGLGFVDSGLATIQTGTASSGNSGIIEILSGNAENDSGIINVATGTSVSASSGYIRIASGGNNGTDSGDITLETGESSAGNSGAVSIYSGAGDISSGAVDIFSGEASGNVANSGNVALGSGSANGTNGGSGENSIYTGDGDFASGGVHIRTGGAANGSGFSGKIELVTGDGALGSYSGNIDLITGSSAGVRGEINLNARQINANSSKIINVTDPVSAQDSATKNYVDNKAATLTTAASGQLGSTTLNAALAELELEKSPRTYSTTVTAAGTTTLSITSNFKQYFTGSTTQTIVLPVAATMTLGFGYLIVNNSSGSLTVNSSGSYLVTTILAGTSAFIDCILTSGTDALSWNVLSFGGAGGANTTLSNLGSTAINANLLPDAASTRNIGSVTFPFATILGDAIRAQSDFNLSGGTARFRTGQTTPTGVAADSILQHVTGNNTMGIVTSNYSSAVNPTTKMLIETGNNSAAGGSGLIKIQTGTAAGAGASGSIELKTGTSASGTRGEVKVDATQLNVNSTKIINVANGTSTNDAINFSQLPTLLAVQTFSASGTYTPTAGMKSCVVQGLGAGGGGGAVGSGAGGSGGAGGGGGAGQYVTATLTAAQIGASKTVTIGAAGTGGAAGNNVGAAGGNTSLGTLVVANGGAGGGAHASSTGALGAQGGLGGTGGTGDFIGTAAAGGVGFNNAQTLAIGGFGAASILGGGGQSNVAIGAGNVTGANATGKGAGGSGGVMANNTSTAGGDGTIGFMTITEYS